MDARLNLLACQMFAYVLNEIISLVISVIHSPSILLRSSAKRFHWSTCLGCFLITNLINCNSYVFRCLVRSVDCTWPSWPWPTPPSSPASPAIAPGNRRCSSNWKSYVGVRIARPPLDILIPANAILPRLPLSRQSDLFIRKSPNPGTRTILSRWFKLAIAIRKGGGDIGTGDIITEIVLKYGLFLITILLLFWKKLRERQQQRVDIKTVPQKSAFARFIVRSGYSVFPVLSILTSILCVFRKTGLYQRTVAVDGEAVFLITTL